MFKKITILATLTFATLCAKADFLYWQVADQGDFTMANLYVTGGGLADPAKINGVLAQGVDRANNVWTGTETMPNQTDLAGYSASQYSFFVEMVTYSNDGIDDNLTKRGYTWSYDELVSNGYISSGSIGTPIAGMVSGGVNMGSPTPEPTSGILVLVGGAMLALRRRRRC